MIPAPVPWSVPWSVPLSTPDTSTGTFALVPPWYHWCQHHYWCGHNTLLGVTIMCEKHFALSAKYIEVIFFTIPIGFCHIFSCYWLSKDKIDSLNQLMVPVPKLVPAPWHHWHRHWHFSSVSKLGTGTNKNWYQPALNPTYCELGKAGCM